MKRLFVIPALAVTALALAVPAHAQSPGWRDSDRLGYAQRSYLDARQAAYDNGFREGIKQGEKDGRKNNVFAFQDERTFQRADKGYHREYGPLDRYRAVVPQRLLRRVFGRLPALRQELRLRPGLASRFAADLPIRTRIRRYPNAYPGYPPQYARRTAARHSRTA